MLLLCMIDDVLMLFLLYSALVATCTPSLLSTRESPNSHPKGVARLLCCATLRSASQFQCQRTNTSGISVCYCLRLVDHLSLLCLRL